MGIFIGLLIGLAVGAGGVYYLCNKYGVIKFSNKP